MSNPLGRAGQAVASTPDPLGHTADPWINSSGEVVAHPNSARGGDGPGDSRSARPLGLTNDPFDSLPHPLAPDSRKLDPNLLGDKAEELDTTDPKPAPVVSADSSPTTINGIELTIKKDASGGSGTGGHTAFEMNAGEQPGADTDGKGKITKVDGKPKITASIQTTYSSGANVNGKSAYGRGTTDDDKKNGNVTLGFHESCHRQDHQDFIKTHTPPAFGGKAGQTEDEYKAAFEAYVAAVETYAKASDANTFAKTDEVGNPTKSQFDKKP